MATSAATGIASAPARWLVGLVALLLFVASSHLPVRPNTVRFGSHPSKKSKSCPAERSVSSLRGSAADRTGGCAKDDPTTHRPYFSEPSFRAISPVAESRLVAGIRRPDYLNSFAPFSTHGGLPPPRA